MQVPITHEIDSIVLQSEGEIARYTNEPCINCGYCVRACPMGLLPNELSKHCEYGSFLAAERNDLHHCIECGICSYVCPAKRPMVHLMRFGKQQLSEQREAS
jgi:electron transport complex protein RnfC